MSDRGATTKKHFLNPTVPLIDRSKELRRLQRTCGPAEYYQPLLKISCIWPSYYLIIYTFRGKGYLGHKSISTPIIAVLIATQVLRKYVFLSMTLSPHTLISRKPFTEEQKARTYLRIRYKSLLRQWAYTTGYYNTTTVHHVCLVLCPASTGQKGFRVVVIFREEDMDIINTLVYSHKGWRLDDADTNHHHF